MDKILRILILEDNPADAELIEFELKNARLAFTSKVVTSQSEFAQHLEDFSPDLVLSDYDLPHYNGALALEEVKKRCPEVPFILVTGAVSEDRAIEILTGGARDYVLKNHLNRLAPAVLRVLAEVEEHKARKKAEEELHETHRILENQVRERTTELQREITERRRALEELQESEERFRSAFDYGAVPMAMTALDDRLLRVNAAFSELLGYSESELAGKTYQEITHPDDIAAKEAGLEPVLKGEQRSFRMEKRYIRKDGRIVWVDMSAAYVRGPDGKPLYIITHCQDITERKKKEQELKRNAELFEAMNKELENFSYTVSHDLQAPLRAIEGFSRMILEDKERELDGKTRERFAAIQENAEKMQRLIRDLLALSRVDRKGISIQKLDMQALVKDAWKEVEMSFPDRPLTLGMKDILPASGDRILIRQVLANLLSNAVKYSANREHIEVEVGSYREEEGNVFYVKDKGIGFDMKYYDKLFAAFQRLHSASQFDGSGIGLSIAQRIIHRHKGKIWAEGREGEGAVFYFMLPCRDDR